MWSEPTRGLADRLEGSTTVNAPHTLKVWGALWSGVSEHVGESAASDDASRVVPDLLERDQEVPPPRGERCSGACGRELP